MATLDPPIPFSGTLNEDDIRTFLRREGDPGVFAPLMLVICFGLVGLVLFMQGGAYAAVAVGAIGLLLIAIVVSTLSYRRLLFINSNPHCFSPVKGELCVDGMYLYRDDVTTFFRWDWFGDALASERMVAFMPATQPDQPQLITLPMIQQADDWSRVLSAAVTPTTEGSGERLRQRNLAMLRDRARERTREIPGGAIRFGGAVGSEDFAQLPSHQRRGHRSWRAKLVLGSLVACGALILAGASSIFFDRVAFLLGLAILYAVLAALGIAFRLRRRGTSRSMVYFMHAWATEVSIVIDYGVTVTEVKWQALRVALRNPSMMVLQRRDSIQVVIVRRDMFENDTEWKRFCVLVTQKLGHSR